MQDYSVFNIVRFQRNNIHNAFENKIRAFHKFYT